MNLRRTIFFLMDKGKLVSDQLEEIRKANSNDHFAEELHRKCISDLIYHLNSNVPFYKSLGVKEFDKLPVVNKIMMKNDPQKFRSLSHLPIGKIRHTSGSTGIPFEIIQDVKKSKRIQAEVIYYRELTGDELGTKYINLLSPSRKEKTSKISDIKQNVVTFDISKMDDSMMKKFQNLLKHNHDIYYLLGFASTLEKIASYFEENKIDEKYSLKAIVSSSEILTRTTKQRLHHIFNCPIYDRYSNEDNGFIAQTLGDDSNDFYVNRGSYYIEILKLDSDVWCEENELGRIVITDYFNYAQPFVRYDTGDLGAFSYRELNGANRFVLTKLAGRVSDMVYDINDNPISTFAIGNALETFDDIKQYQLIQHSRTEFTINIIDPYKRYSESDYRQALQNVLGDTINVSLVYLESIPKLRSGKYKRVICNYNPNELSKKK